MIGLSFGSVGLGTAALGSNRYSQSRKRECEALVLGRLFGSMWGSMLVFGNRRVSPRSRIDEPSGCLAASQLVGGGVP